MNDNNSNITSYRNFCDYGRQQYMNSTIHKDINGNYARYVGETGEEVLERMSINYKYNQKELHDYFNIITYDVFCHIQEFINAKQIEIFSICNRMLICKCDNNLLWACDRIPSNYDFLSSNYCNNYKNIDSMIYEWNSDSIYVGKCFIYKNCLILSKAKRSIRIPSKMKICMVNSYLQKWHGTKYSIIAGDSLTAIIYYTDSGFVVPKLESEPIMNELGYDAYYGSWAYPGFWSIEKQNFYNYSDDYHDWFCGFERQSDINCLEYFILRTNENYDYGLCCTDNGLCWSYTAHNLKTYSSVVYLGSATIDRNVLILHKVHDELHHALGEFDSDAYFADWPAWKGSKYFIPPTGKYLYYAETGNIVPIDEASSIMTELGYTFQPSMMVGDTEAGLFWYKPAIGEAP